LSSHTLTFKQAEPAVDGDVLAEVPSTEVLMKVVADGDRGGSAGSQSPRMRSARELPSMQRSQFGRQQDSGKQNSPSFGFGTGQGLTLVPNSAQLDLFCRPYNRFSS
jgi:hypothetical protein